MTSLQLICLRASRVLSTRHLWKTGLLALPLSLCLPASAQAQEFQCETPGAQRILKVETPGRTHLCEVSVTKSETGIRKVLWFADNNTAFCLARAYELRKKYEETWNFTCTASKDSHGLDTLSPAQRLVLDERLKFHINAGKTASPPYRIRKLRAVASTPANTQSSKIALQFFTDNGEFTEIVDDKTQYWNVTHTLEQLSTFVTSDVPVESALLTSISDAGALEVQTQMNDTDNAICNGLQIVKPVENKNSARAGSPHRFFCKGGNKADSAIND